MINKKDMETAAQLREMILTGSEDPRIRELVCLICVVMARKAGLGKEELLAEMLEAWDDSEAFLRKHQN